MQWVERTLTCERPSPRGGHASAMVETGAGGTALIVIGGSDPFGAATNEVVRVDLAAEGGKGRATILQGNTTQSPFLPRMGHTAHALPAHVAKAVGDALVGAAPEDGDYCHPIAVFGGASMLPEPCAHNSVFLLYVLRNVMDEFAKPESERRRLVRWVDITPMLKGKLPVGRHAHSSCLVGADQSLLLVAGGSTGETLLGDIHLLDLATLSWTNLEGAIPPREMSAACAVPGGAMVIGGRDENGVVRGDMWRVSAGLVTPESKAIPGRCCHTVTQHGPSLVVVGGFSCEGMPTDDLLVPLDGNAVATPIKRLDQAKEALHFGLGHSLAADPTSGQVFVVSGIHPNTVGGSLSVYETPLR